MQIDNNLFITFFWAFFFASLAVTATMFVFRLFIQAVSVACNWLANSVAENVSRLLRGWSAWRSKPMAAINAMESKPSSPDGLEGRL